MKEMITNSRLKEKLRVGLGLIKQANEMIDKLNLELKKKDEQITKLSRAGGDLASELDNIKSHWTYKIIKLFK